MISLLSAYCTTFFCNKVWMLLTPWGRESCISKTACFSVNRTPLSLQFGQNEEPKGSNGSRPSECGNQTPPSKLDTAPFLCKVLVLPCICIWVSVWRFLFLLQLCQRSLFLWLCINIYLATLGNVVRVCPRIVQGLTFLSA